MDPGFCSSAALLPLHEIACLVNTMVFCAGLLTDAVLSFDKAIECEPGPRSAPRLYNRAFLLRRMGRLQDAAADFAAAMDLDVNEAKRCSVAIADIEEQARERGAVSNQRHAPLSPEPPSPRATPVIQGGMYLCCCNPLQPTWREVCHSPPHGGVGLPRLRNGILEAVTPPRPKDPRG